MAYLRYLVTVRFVVTQPREGSTLDMVWTACASTAVGLAAAMIEAPSRFSVVTDQIVSTPDFTMTFSVADVADLGPYCIDVPLTNSYTKARS